MRRVCIRCLAHAWNLGEPAEWAPIVIVKSYGIHYRTGMHAIQDRRCNINITSTRKIYSHNAMMLGVLQVLHRSGLELSTADLLKAELGARQHEVVDVNIAPNEIADAGWEAPCLGGKERCVGHADEDW